MTTPIKKRKYYDGLIPINLDGSLGWEGNHNFTQDEIIQYGGMNDLVVKDYKDGKIYDLSKYIIKKFDIGYVGQAYRNGTYINVYAQIVGGIFRQNFRFQDNLTYFVSCRNGHCFKDATDKTHYVARSDFDEYFVPNMVKGHISGIFTHAKRGPSCWLTLVTD